MDLFKIGRKSKDVFEYVSDLLDGERSLLEDENEPSKETPFETRSDIDSLLNFPIVAKRGRSRSEVLFQKLSPFYEAGFCLKKSGDAWLVTHFFLYGKEFAPEEHQAVPFHFPEVKAGTVIRGRSAAVLKAFRLDTLSKLKDSNTFLFAAGSQQAYLLLSERPFPWLDELVQDTQLVLETFLG